MRGEGEPSNDAVGALGLLPGGRGGGGWWGVWFSEILVRAELNTLDGPPGRVMIIYSCRCHSACASD